MWKVRPSLMRRDSAPTTSAVNCSTTSCTRREAAAVWPSTARNALVIATEILLASNFETAPLRRITCIGRPVSGATSFSGRNWNKGAALVSSEMDAEDSDIGRPRSAVVEAGCLLGTLHRMRGAKHRHGSASDRRDTPPVDVFFGVAAGLLARRSTSHPVFPMQSRISDVK